MTARIILIHGFNVRDRGAKTTDQLKQYFLQAGYTDIVEFDYLWTGLLRVRLCNKSKAYILAKNIAKRGCIAVGHSNGCAIINQAAQLGAPFHQVVYINPALNKKTKLAKQVSQAHVWHSANDRVVSVSKFLPRHSWGDMGRKGYHGNDNRYTNYETANGQMSYGRAGTEGHSDIFESDKLNHWGPKIVEALRP